jgi:glutaredoxin
MNIVTIYSKKDCHLCDRMKARVKELQRRYPFELREVDIREGDEFFDVYKERIPVLTINGLVAFEYVLAEEEFLRKLAEAG